MQTTFKINSLTGKELFSSANTIFKLIDPKQFVKFFYNEYIRIPDFQRGIDDDKVNDIKNILLSGNDDWLIQQGFITLGSINNSNDILYLIDGQHRYKAIESIINDYIVFNKSIVVMIIRFNNINQMKDHFRTINSHSSVEPIYTYFDNEIIRATILKIKALLLEQYSKSFRKIKTKSDITHNYHIDEFIKLFDPTLVKQLYDTDRRNYNDYEHLFGKIMYTNLEAQQKLNDFQTQNIRHYYMSDKDYDKCRSNDFYLAYDMIHIANFIFNIDDDIIIDANYRPKKAIPQKIRKEVWKKRNKSLNGNCYCCNAEIEYDNFHCGHIIAESKGGPTILSNLEPTCMNCNLGMRTQNLDDYKNILLSFNS